MLTNYYAKQLCLKMIVIIQAKQGAAIFETIYRLITHLGTYMAGFVSYVWLPAFFSNITATRMNGIPPMRPVIAGPRRGLAPSLAMRMASPAPAFTVE